MKRIWDNDYLHLDEFNEHLDFITGLPKNRNQYEWGLINAIWLISDRSNQIEKWAYRDTYMGYGFSYEVKDGELYVDYAFVNSPSWGKVTAGDKILINEPFELTRETVQDYLSNMIRKKENKFTILRNESKQINKINQSLESIFEKLNPQGNAYPSPFPTKSK